MISSTVSLKLLSHDLNNRNSIQLKALFKKWCNSSSNFKDFSWSFYQVKSSRFFRNAKSESVVNEILKKTKKLHFSNFIVSLILRGEASPVQIWTSPKAKIGHCVADKCHSIVKSNGPRGIIIVWFGLGLVLERIFFNLGLSRTLIVRTFDQLSSKTQQVWMVT